MVEEPSQQFFSINSSTVSDSHNVNSAQSQQLLDEGQFNNECDRKMAESDARRHLGVPIPIPDDERSVLPHAVPSGEQADMNKP